MKRNPDGLPMKEGQNVPLAAGVDAENPAVTLHDAAIPAVVRTKDGRAFNLRESHDYHERVEYALMQAGLEYADAHRYATECEHKRCRDLGFDPNEIELLAKPFINAAEHRAKAEANYRATDTLDAKPYVDDDKTELLGAEPEGEHEYYDKDGNCYYEPETFAALGRLDFVVARSDTGYVAVEPTTATVWVKAKTFSGAVREVTAKVKKMGLIAAREQIDAATPWSQQQLQEIYDRDGD